ncbi:hypothetical protein Dsin_022711 [Dipteronia sinensis]|uniref:Uncharacterized protein n=1 Tax=Dipteronia sinensis TaxID=43782 RepID=A0AAE0A3I1_9ROSI|nr:hypothetical protein Dsin_022711 [Dipteronia sinensis]
MATDHHHHQQQKYNNPMSYNIALDHETRPDRDLGFKEKARKANKRGSSSSSTQKKKPQRGMGVAQLERLRLQEGFKKMTQMPPPPPPPPPPSNLNLQTQFHHYQYYSNNHHHHHHHFPLPEPIPSVPVMYAAGHYGVPSAASAVGYGGGFMMMGLEQGLVYQKHGNGGSGHFSMDPYRVVVGGNLSGVETSQELSSIPKLQLQQQQCVVVPERCDCCSKKKRFNGDNRIGSFDGGKDKYADQFSQLVNNGYDHHQIPGVLKQENNFNGGLIKSSFGARAARSALYAGHLNINEGLEVVAVHRNGKSSMGKNVVMEYEFFPAGKGSSGGRSRSTSSKELGLSTEAESSVAVGGGEASYFTTSAYNNNLRAASNSIDLSLKLSY